MELVAFSRVHFGTLFSCWSLHLFLLATPAYPHLLDKGTGLTDDR
jgi:hypothetical protein